jgi:hypothetical protein
MVPATRLLAAAMPRLLFPWDSPIPKVIPEINPGADTSG